MRRIAFAVTCLLAGSGLLNAENLFQAEARKEAGEFKTGCLHGTGFIGTIAGCAPLLFTGQPFHIAVGSLAPQNGFGAGVALVTHYTPNENWRLFFNFDAVATPNGSWRAGGYMTAVRTRHPKILVLPGGSAAGSGGVKVEEMPAFHLYGQNTSLNKLAYYGLGQNSSLAGLAWYGMRETILGANAVVPVSGPLNLSLMGEANGRFIDIRPNHNEKNPSLEQMYNDSTAPGLLRLPAYAQFGEGVRMRPALFADHLRLNYSAAFQEWVTPEAGYSFNRFKADLSHTIPLYKGMRSLNPQEFNGPDSCLQGVSSKTCPGMSRNLEGSISLSFLYTASLTGATGSVPFYLDPTIGGSDIDGVKLLPSYADYRFRGPNLMCFRAAFEHSVYKWPLGVKFMVDEGRVALHPGDLGISHLAHSYAAGFTIHAGGLPVIDLLFAWGGHEGTHNIASMDNALTGGSLRPSLH